MRNDDSPSGPNADPDAVVSELAATLFAGRLDAGETLDAVARAARRALGADRATCYTLTPDRLVGSVHTTETEPTLRRRIVAAVGRGAAELPVWRAILARRDGVLAVPDALRSRIVPVALARAIESGAFLGVRLAHAGPEGVETELGFMFVSWRDPRPIGRSERQTASALAGLAAPALATAGLAVRTLDALVRARRAEAEMARALRITQVGSWTLHVGTGAVEWSPELWRTAGLDPARGASVTGFLERVHLEDRARVSAVHQGMLRGDSPFEVQFRLVRPDGGERVVLSRGERDADEGSDAACYHGTLQDVTDLVRAGEELRLQARLLDAVDAAVIATDLGRIVTHWNRAAERAHGWSAAEAVGRPIAEVTAGPADGATTALITASILAHGYWEGELEVGHRDGTSFPAFVRDALMHDQAGAPSGLVRVSIDIRARVRMEQALKAGQDFLATVTESMGEGLFTVDEDGRVTYMNPAAERMTGWSRAELVGRRLHDAIHDHPASPDPLFVERRTGADRRSSPTPDDDVIVRRDGSLLAVALLSVPFQTPAGVVGQVLVMRDISERRAREEGMRRDIELLRWDGRIRAALAEERFVLYAQPIVELSSRRVVQHELLIRMVDEGGGVVAPGEFLPAAEECGLIRDIDRWVVRQGTAFAAAGHAIEINLSATSVGDAAVYGEIERGIRDAGVDPALIVFELTETAVLANYAVAQTFVRRIRQLGCGVALDDFGTGYGGFYYLKHLPVDLLKIDIEFVRDLGVNPASHHVVEAIVNLARAFGQRTVAEGVENLETLALLLEHGVDLGQGYGIARPKPAWPALERAMANEAVIEPASERVDGRSPGRKAQSASPNRILDDA